MIFTYRANNHSTTAWKLCLFSPLMICFKKLFTLLTGPNGLCVDFFYCTEYFQMKFNVKMHHVLKSLSEKQFVLLHMCRLSSLQIAFQDGNVTQYSRRFESIVTNDARFAFNTTKSQFAILIMNFCSKIHFTVKISTCCGLKM